MKFFKGYMPPKNERNNKNISKSKLKRKLEKEQQKLGNNGLPHKKEQLYKYLRRPHKTQIP